MYNDGLPILYGENIITASSPLTSFNFDEDLAALSGKHRQLIRWISLEIGWADDLWAKFPLVARYVGEIRGLKGLEIVILEQNQKPEGGRRAITGNVGREIKREGQLSEMMLKAEKKMFRDLVEVLQSLREFYLVGFRDKDFAMRLESWVGAGRRKT